MKKSVNYRGQAIEYELEKKRVKNINLRIDRQGNIRVAAPIFTSSRAVEAFILSRAERILQTRGKLMNRAEAMRDEPNSIILCGERLDLEIMPGKQNRAQLENGRVVFTLKDRDAESLKKTLGKLLRQIAEERVRDCCRRVYPVFAALGVKEPELSFRAMKRSWGNCRPGEGRLCFNTALARVPEDCVEYVVCHEFCHFIQPDHSPRFHALMTKLLPDWKERKKELEKYAPLM